MSGYLFTSFGQPKYSGSISASGAAISASLTRTFRRSRLSRAMKWLLILRARCKDVRVSSSS